MFRIVLLVASALATGIVTGRQAVTREVARKRDEMVDRVAIMVRDQIKQDAHRYIAQSVQHYALNMLIKIIVVAILLSAKIFGVINDHTFIIATSVALSYLLVRDFIRAWPTLKLGFLEFRKHGWKPRYALGEIVAARVFDRVLNEAANQPISAVETLVLKFAGESQDSLARHVAAAVADIARSTTWHDLRPFLAWAGISVTTLAIFYSVFLTAAIRLNS